MQNNYLPCHAIIGDSEMNEMINPLATPEQPPLEDFLKDLQWLDADLSRQWLDPTEPYTSPEYTLSYCGVPFAPLGGIHGLTGKPGHGKTMTFTQLMVAIMRGDFYNLHSLLRERCLRSGREPKVLYVDTEMEKGNTQLVMMRVYQEMGWEKGSVHSQFRILWLREVLLAEDRWRMTLRAIYEMRPDVVFLDGLIDVIGDFNDNRACQLLIYQCMAVASHYHISLWCLLHENPGSDKMVGHAGSFLERKATDILRTKKDKSGARATFSVSQAKNRARDFEDWIFHIEDDANHYGHPVMDNAIDDAPKALSTEELREIMQVIGYEERLSKRALRDRIRNSKTVGTSKAENYIDDAVKCGVLICENNRYRLADNLITADNSMHDDDNVF